MYVRIVHILFMNKIMANKFRSLKIFFIHLYFDGFDDAIMRFNRADNTSSAKNDELSKVKIPLFNVNLDTLISCCCFFFSILLLRYCCCLCLPTSMYDFARLRVIRIPYVHVHIEDYDLSMKIKRLIIIIMKSDGEHSRIINVLNRLFVQHLNQSSRSDNFVSSYESSFPVLFFLFHLFKTKRIFGRQRDLTTDVTFRLAIIIVVYCVQ